MAEIIINGNIGNVGENEPNFTEADMAVFLSANKNDFEHTVIIRSGGGFVEAGFKIYDMLRASGKRIKTVAYQADSIASVIFLAGDIREVASSAKPLIHNPFIPDLYIEYATAIEIENVQKAVKSIEDRILKIYSERTGADKKMLSVIMERNEPITAEMFKALGFAHNIVSESENENAQAYKAVAMSNEINFTNKMNNEKTNSLLEKIVSLLTRVKSTVKNLNATLQDGTPVYVQTEFEEPAVNDTVWMDEAMTEPAPDGVHTLENGVQIATLGGVITEVIAVEVEEVGVVEDAEKNKMKEEIESLKAEIETLKASVESANTAKAELETKVENFNKAKAANETRIKDVTKELEDLKAMVLDAKSETNEPVKKSFASEQLELRRKLRASKN